VEKPEGKGPHVRPRCRRKVGIKTDLKEKKDWMMQTGFLWLSTGTSNWLL